jgi:hypothetical protein
VLEVQQVLLAVVLALQLAQQELLVPEAAQRVRQHRFYRALGPSSCQDLALVLDLVA